MSCKPGEQPHPPPGCGHQKFPKNFTLTPGHHQYLNPGNVGSMHKRTRDIMPQFFNGVKFTYRKNMTSNRSLMTSWILSDIYPSGFRIGAKYYCQKHGNILSSPIIEADVNPSTLSSNFSVLYYPVPWLRLQTRFQRLEESDIYNNTITVEKTSPCSTLSLNAYNADAKSGRVTLSYLRRITDMFSAGTELQVDWCRKDMIAKTAFAAKYGSNRYVLAATISPEALDISYWRRVHKSIQVGSSLAFNNHTQKSIGSIYYQWEFKDAFVRGMVNSDWSTGFMYSRNLSLLPCTLGLSLLFCIPNNRFAFGLTLDLDSAMACS